MAVTATVTNILARNRPSIERHIPDKGLQFSPIKQGWMDDARVSACQILLNSAKQLECIGLDCAVFYVPANTV